MRWCGTRENVCWINADRTNGSRKKHVVLFAPKGAKEGVWDPKLRELLPDLFGTDFSNLAVFSHTDLNREGEYPGTV